jgi:arylformamidase
MNATKPIDFDQYEIIDISPALSPKTAVFPGDTPLSRSIELDFKKNDNLLLSSINLSVHLGAHTDAPNHYHKDGKAMHEVDPHLYIGSCQVITVSLPKGARILPEHIKNASILSKRVLFKTGSFPDPNLWNGDFNSLSPELADYLSRKGVILVGIDTPSIDPSDSKALETHNAVYRNKMAVLEGIVLDQVADGLYTLIALPLKIVDGDASPVRAILLKTNA